MAFYTSYMTILSKYVGHIVCWQHRVLVEATTLRGLDNCDQIWGMDGLYCDNMYVCEDERYVFTREIVCYWLSYADDVYVLKEYSGDGTHSLLSSCF